jgi:hypothetical protein
MLCSDHRGWLPIPESRVSLFSQCFSTRSMISPRRIAHIIGILSATRDGRDDRNLRSGGDGTRKSTRVTNILVPDENIDMFPNFSLLCCNAISNARVECPQRRQRVCQGSGRVFDLHSAVPASQFAQGTRNVKGYWHNHRLVRRDLFVAGDFARDEVASDALDNVGPEPAEASSTTAFRTQTTAGSPSSIFCHVLPSSVEPKSCPLRVPK